MDTIAVAAGQRDHLLSILCQPNQILETVRLPLNTRLIGIHSRARWRPSHSAYIDARTAAFMGLTILRKTLDLEELRDNYLCRLSVSDFRQKCWKVLPARMRGADFLDSIRRDGRSPHHNRASKGVRRAQPRRTSDL